MFLPDLFDVAPYSWAAIGTAAFCGAIIGIERQLRGKPVGIRTSALITLGTYLFLSTAFNLQGDVIDHSRSGANNYWYWLFGRRRNAS